MMSLIVPALLALVGAAAGNGVRTNTPPMGWMSWEIFRCDLDCSTDPQNCISENLYMAQTDALVAGGYVDAGYVSIHLDDCWMTSTRDSQGRLQPDPQRFPSGMQALGNYMHERGVFFAMYTAESNHTCAGYMASGGNEQIDAETFASWGVDYMKVDGCNPNNDYYPTGYPKMGAALRSTGRQIVYSCSWPAYLGDNETAKPFDLMIDAGCNLWRNWDDIQCNSNSLFSIINHWGDYGEFLQTVASPSGTYGGHFNDPDMLLIGNDCITDDEARTQMAIWSIVAAPLIMGNDLRNVSATTKAILLNQDAISVNQDPLGKQGLRVGPQNATEVWYRELLDGRVAVALLNKATTGHPQPQPCDTWNITKNGYLEACGGSGGDITCFNGWTLEYAQQQCCANSMCAGFSFLPSDGSGCLKTNTDCGFFPNPGYVGYNRPGFQPPAPVPANITVSFSDIGSAKIYSVWDIWAQKDLGLAACDFTAYNVPYHGTAFYILTPVDSSKSL